MAAEHVALSEAERLYLAVQVIGGIAIVLAAYAAAKLGTHLFPPHHPRPF